LQQRSTDSWHYCLIQGNAELSFEVIQNELARDISQSRSDQIVLIVDNAGELVPGLIATLIQYAAANPVLRVVFALTHDELQMKRGSDRVVDDCHIIEIPPLSEKQSGDFLRYLSAEPYANLVFKAIDENMIAHIYRDTHGIPGRIIDEISGVSGAKPRGKLTWVLVLAAAVAIAVVIAFGVYWKASPAIAPSIALPPASSMPSTKDNDQEAIASAVAEQKKDGAESQPEPAKPILPIEQPVTQPQGPQSSVVPNTAAVVENQGNVEKEAIVPLAEANVSQDPQKTVVPFIVAKPETADTIVIKPLPENKPFDDVQQNIVEPPVSEIKAPVNSAGIAPVERKPSNKQSVTAQQKMAKPLATKQEQAKKTESNKAVNNSVPPSPENQALQASSEPKGAMAERLWAKQKELKQAELGKTVNSVVPAEPNKQEAIQIAQKPVDIVSAPNEPAVETATPPQAAPVSLAPSANNFTLHLMALSKQSSADEMLRKHPALAPDIRVVKTIVKGKEKFVLEYGSYSDAESANKARQSLPFEFRKALVRKIVR
jgi:DamX protein